MDTNRKLDLVYSRSKLFNDKDRKKLVHGGVVREEVYKSLRPRIIYILKDPGPTQEEWWCHP